MTSERVRYRDAKAMNCFSTIPGVSFVLLHGNGFKVILLINRTTLW